MHDNPSFSRSKDFPTLTPEDDMMDLVEMAVADPDTEDEALRRARVEMNDLIRDAMMEMLR